MKQLKFNKKNKKKFNHFKKLIESISVCMNVYVKVCEFPSICQSSSTCQSLQVF